jgi:hypothetical protein
LSAGNPPVLVSASLDCTVKVWNLEAWSLLKTIEGHTADVTSVRIFPLGGGDLALVSSSSDASTRIVYEFLETAPQYDVVMQLFEFDLNGTNTHVVFDTDSAFPRIAQLARKEGEEQFFGTYHFLFGEALRKGRPDFLEEFLHKSYLGLLKSNQPESVAASPVGGRVSVKPTGRGTVRVITKGAVGQVVSAKQAAHVLKTGKSTHSLRGSKGDLTPSPRATSKRVFPSSPGLTPEYLGSFSADEKDHSRSDGGKTILANVANIAGAGGAVMGAGGAVIGAGGAVMGEVGGMLQSALLLKKHEHSHGMVEEERQYGSLLHQALERRDTRAVRCIVDCWCRFFTENRSDLIYDEHFGRISMPDMIFLADVAALDFQKLICCIRLVPTKNNFIAPGKSHHLSLPLRMVVACTVVATPSAEQH